VCNASGQCDPDVPGINAPNLIQHGASVNQLNPGASVTFSVLATDPNGSADLLGALLTDVTTGNIYGVFDVDAPGTFGLMLSWDAIHAIVPIHEDSFGSREFSIEVFDNEGNRAAVIETVNITCSDPALTPCHKTKGATTNRLQSIPGDILSGTILTPPPIYFPE